MTQYDVKKLYKDILDKEQVTSLHVNNGIIEIRYADGTMTNYEPIENVHQNQILYKSKIPANISDTIFKSAINNAKKIIIRV